MTACSWPWEIGKKVESMEVVFKNASLPPGFYTESSLTLVPDYKMRTLVVDYKMDRPFKKEKTPEDSFSGEAVIGGDNFDKFLEVREVFEQEEIDSADPCIGGDDYFITVKYGEEEELSKTVYGCDKRAEVIDEFFEGVEELLTKNVKI